MKKPTTKLEGAAPETPASKPLSATERALALTAITALENANVRLARANELIASAAHRPAADYGPALVALTPTINTLIEAFMVERERSRKKR